METFFRDIELYNKERPMEVTDMLNGLDKIIEHDNRTIGQQQMQHRVLQWAVAHKDELSPAVKDGLIECMEASLAQMKRDRPKQEAA
jgi:hypothetical protein